MANQYGAGGTRKLFRAAGFKRGQSLDEISNNLQRVIKNKYGKWKYVVVLRGTGCTAAMESQYIE